jgi:hypothetical protein
LTRLSLFHRAAPRARKRAVEIWLVLLWDPLALTEILSGALLVFLRGAVLAWGPLLHMPADVAFLLREVGITEDRWGTYLMVLGVVQILTAGNRTSRLRVATTIGILAGFVTMAAAFVVANGLTPVLPGEQGGSVVPSLICMSALYAALLARIFHDRERVRPIPDREGTARGGERGG